MTTFDIALSAGFILVMVLVAGAGVLQALVAVTLVAYFVYPRIMVGEVADDRFFVGISWSHAVVITCHVAMVIVLIYGIVRRKGLSFQNVLPVVPLLAFSTVFFSLGWTHSRPMTAGYLHLLTISASWAVGCVLFCAVDDHPNGQRILSKWIAGVASFIALVCILQVSGFDINSNSTKLLRSAAGARDTIAGVRVVSTFNEPTAAGKFLFLLAIIAVVWLFGRDSLKKRNSALMMVAAVVVAVLTQTRSNFAALGALVLLYSLAVNRRNLLTRVALTTGAAVLVIFASFSRWDARFSAGEGIRGHTIDVALAQITGNPDAVWAGIGPNRYFEVLAPLDSWVARGYPAHNSVLYLLVELGVLGTFCYLLPFIALTVKSIQAVRRGNDRLHLAKAWLCSIPGLLLIAMFGWGLLSVAAPSLSLVMGYIFASLTQSRRSEFQIAKAHSAAGSAERAPAKPRELQR